MVRDSEVSSAAVRPVCVPNRLSVVGVMVAMPASTSFFSAAAAAPRSIIIASGQEAYGLKSLGSSRDRAFAITLVFSWLLSGTSNFTELAPMTNVRGLDHAAVVGPTGVTRQV